MVGLCIPKAGCCGAHAGAAFLYDHARGDVLVVTVDGDELPHEILHDRVGPLLGQRVRVPHVANRCKSQERTEKELKKRRWYPKTKERRVYRQRVELAVAGTYSTYALNAQHTDAALSLETVETLEAWTKRTLDDGRVDGAAHERLVGDGRRLRVGIGRVAG
jgi:hypothetical protein